MAKIPAHQEVIFFSVVRVVLYYYICKGDGCCKDILLYGCYSFYAILIKKELGSENEAHGEFSISLFLYDDVLSS